MPAQFSSQPVPLCSRCLGPREPGQYGTCNACRHRHAQTYETGTVQPVTPIPANPLPATNTVPTQQLPLIQPTRSVICSQCFRRWESAAAGYQTCYRCRARASAARSTGTFPWSHPRRAPAYRAETIRPVTPILANPLLATDTATAWQPPLSQPPLSQPTPWVICSQCHQFWQPAATGNQICYRCRARESAARSTGVFLWAQPAPIIPW